MDTAGFKRGLGGPPEDTLNRGNVNGKHWIPAEADVSIRPGWFYHPEQDTKVKTPETLFSLYLRSVGNGGNLLLNVPPDKRGLFHAADSAALVGFRKLREEAFKTNVLAKATLRTNQHSTYPVQNMVDEKNETFWVGKQSNQDLVISIQLPKVTAINAIVLEEMIAYGQRIQSFSIEANTNKGMQTIFEGTTIGRKKIACFPLITTQSLQIRIKQSKEAPILRNIMGYQINGLDKLGLWNTNETKVN